MKIFRVSPLTWANRILAAAFAAVLAVHVYAALLNVLQPPATVLMAQRSLEGQTVRRDPVPLNQISPYLVQGVIAAEDNRFCTHDGIDFAALDQVIRDYQRGKPLRGASTISQQTAKNVFFWNGGGFVRKGGEAWMTIVLERSLGKRRIMSVYLNTIEWGDGLFGAEAAAQARFGKPASDLTRREAALLASVLPNPQTWRVDPPGPYVSKRAPTIEARMRDADTSCVFSG